MEQFSFDLFAEPEPERKLAGPVRRTYSVTELNAEIRSVLGAEFEDIWVSGEISGLRQVPSGHCYFTLKERDAQIRCVCFKSTYRLLKCKPQDGLAVLARGRVDVFEARGEYQLIVEVIEPQGHGALQLAFEQLKKRLMAEGLFDRERKKALPRFPFRIGIVTSPRGAVISDMLRVLDRRFPGLQIRLFPAAVQGEGAADEVRRALLALDRMGWAEVIILARGGGSLEDLWTFNEELVARAIDACKTPVISAIGHETDVTIADFVADLRAPTPSAAAELVICTRQEIVERLSGLEARAVQRLRYRFALLHRRLEQQGIGRATAVLQRNLGRRLQMVDDKAGRIREQMRLRLERARRRWREIDAGLRHEDLRPRLQRDRVRLLSLTNDLERSLRARLDRSSRRWETLEAQLSQLSPLRILERGYAIATGPDGRILKSSGETSVGAEVTVRLAAGKLGTRVERLEQAEAARGGRASRQA